MPERHAEGRSGEARSCSRRHRPLPRRQRPEESDRRPWPNREHRDVKKQRTLAEAITIASLRSRRKNRALVRDEQEVNPNSQSHKWTNYI